MDEITNKCVAEADKIPCEQRKCGQCSYLYFPSDDCAECDKDKGVSSRDPMMGAVQSPGHHTLQGSALVRDVMERFAWFGVDFNPVLSLAFGFFVTRPSSLGIIIVGLCGPTQLIWFDAHGSGSYALARHYGGRGSH